MSSVEYEKASAAGAAEAAAASAIGRFAAVRGLFIATLFLSAFLLFGVQPMFTKMVLPVLGGSPSVWSVAMVFFQGLLLIGYVYAHMLTRHARPGTAAIIHLCVCAAALLTLPIGLAASAGAPPDSGHAVWLIGLFAVSVGAPFFALSANGPLLQAWFASTPDPRARDPYFLYGASNIGSFSALLAYPFLIEPWIGLAAQSAAWAKGFLVLAVAIGVCALVVARSRTGAEVSRVHQPSRAAPERPRATARAFAAWVGLGFVPSGLLVSVTAHISTDVAAAPLLWVLPLALFLLTFVIAFRDRPVPGERLLGAAQIWLSVLVLLFIATGEQWLIGGLIIHHALFFLSAFLCHRTLYNLRPASQDLTAFYVAMSLGGVLGGLFAALAAPNLFSSVVEYPLLIVAAMLCGPAIAGHFGKFSLRAYAIPALMAAAILLAIWALAGTAIPATRAPIIATAILAGLCILWWRSPVRVTVFAIAACIATTALYSATVLRETHRSFFGVHKIREIRDGKFRVLIHGATLHGAMRIKNEDGSPAPRRPLPATYYSFEGPIGEAIRSVRKARGSLAHIYAIGQGVGSLACHRKANEKLTFFEIDPLVIKIAADPSKFRFMSECAPDAKVVLGDARLTLARAPALAPIVVVDAFSSDAIPVHLLTREAFALYLSRLDEQGAIVFHISNKAMDLSHIVARVAAEHGLKSWMRVDDVPASARKDMRTGSMAMAMARQAAHLGPLTGDRKWRRIRPDMKARPWTDDYSTILTAIADKFGKRR